MPVDTIGKEQVLHPGAGMQYAQQHLVSISEPGTLPTRHYMVEQYTFLTTHQKAQTWLQNQILSLVTAIPYSNYDLNN